MERENENIVDVMEVCRLCLGTDNLISVFDDRIRVQQNIVEIIQITSGVTITVNDNVSHKLCSKCINITIKMFKFRSSSIVNDNQLKGLAEVKLKVRMSETVGNLLKKYPNIKLPSSISESNVSPVVTINKNEVSYWLERFEKERIAKENRRNEAENSKKLIKNSLTSENNIISHESSNIELSHTMVIESSEPITPTSQLSTSRESAVLPDVKEVDKDQNQSLQETVVPDINLLPLKNSDKTCKRASVEQDCRKSKKMKSSLDLSDGNSIDSLVTVKYVNKSLSICDICNGILYNAKDLKKHKLTHMRCSLCKKVFKTMKETNEHNESGCFIKQIMNNLPSLKLKRCDDIEDVSTFGNQSDKIAPVLAEPDLLTEQEKRNKEVIKESFRVDPVVSSFKSVSNIDPNEIFLISDDEDEGYQPVMEKDKSVIAPNEDLTSRETFNNKTQIPDYGNKNKPGTSNNTSLNILSVTEYHDKTAESKSSSSIEAPHIEIAVVNMEVDSTNNVISDSEDEEHQLVIEEDTSIITSNEDNTSSKIPCNETQDSTYEETTGTSNKTTLKNINAEECINETAALSSRTSIIAPNIEMTGANIIGVDFADNDNALLKNLLRRVKHDTKDAGIQTAIPCNADITPTLKNDKLFELKNLRDYLNFYKIPINVSYAAQHSVRYSNESSPLRKNRPWSKINTKESKNVPSSKLRKIIPKSSAVEPIKIKTTTPVVMSPAECVPDQIVTNVKEGNTNNESLIPTYIIQNAHIVPTSVYKNTGPPVSLITSSESTPMAISSPSGILPQLVPLVQKGNVINKSVTSTAAIKKTQFNTNGQTVLPTASNSVNKYIEPKQQTLNSPILLNYSLNNLNSTYIVPNNFLLSQPSSSQSLPTNAATTDKTKKGFTFVPSKSKNYNNLCATNSTHPLRLPSISSPTSVNMSNAVSRMKSSTIVKVSKGITIITPKNIVSTVGGRTCSKKVNKFNVPPSIACPTNMNMKIVPSGKPTETRINSTCPDTMSSIKGGYTKSVSLTNNMPPPASSFIPHRIIQKKMSSTATQICARAKTDSVDSNLTTHSKFNSNFKQTIRVKDMSELK